MKTKIVLASLFLCLALATQEGFGVFLVDDDTIVSQTTQATLIVAGTVSDIQYTQPNLKVGRIYTDVTINVSKTLKGKPNIDEDTVRFRIEGGIGIHPVNGKPTISEYSSTPKFKLGEERIIFFYKRTLDDWEKFYNGLYPIPFPPPPRIEKVQGAEGEYKIARFYLAFYRERYRLNVPVDIAFRLIENAIKAPEDLTLLEEKIRPLKDITLVENRGKTVETEKFLSMLKTELAKIETKIKETEAEDEQ